MRVLVTGGAGFLGSHFVDLLQDSDYETGVLDGLVYPGRRDYLPHDGFQFYHTNLKNRDAVSIVLRDFKPDLVAHFAAESHVDFSIQCPSVFLESNVLGTGNLLEAIRKEAPNTFFLHISTDEVFGDSMQDGVRTIFRKGHPYKPSSPYSASKASSDHLVRSWTRTYGLRAAIVHITNNYGARQAKDKLIPASILRLFRGETLKVYGSGEQSRDWLYVRDCVEGLLLILKASISQSKPFRQWFLAGQNLRSNLEVMKMIISECRELGPEFSRLDESWIEHVQDRPGHDQFYHLDDSEDRELLHWCPATSWEVGLRMTVEWYFRNQRLFK